MYDYMISSAQFQMSSLTPVHDLLRLVILLHNVLIAGLFTVHAGNLWWEVLHL